MLREQALSPQALASRRGRRYRRPVRRRGAAADWLWGLAIGAVVLFVVGGFFLVTGPLSGGGSACDKPLVALGTSEVSAKAFVEEDIALGKVIDQLNAGDKSGAESTFYGPVHNFTHNVDPPIREKNAQVAKDLCRSVLTLEDDLAFSASVLKLSGSAQRVRDLLRDGAEALGYPRPE